MDTVSSGPVPGPAPVVGPTTVGTENRIQLRYVVPFLILCGIGFFVARNAWFYSPSRESNQPRVMPTTGAPAVVVVTATPSPTAPATYTPYPTYTPWVVKGVERVIVVTATPEPTAVPTQTPIVKWRTATCPTAVPAVACPVVPTAVPTVSPGLLRVCVDVEGVSGVYVDGVGVAGHSCTYVPSVGLHQIEVTR